MFGAKIDPEVEAKRVAERKARRIEIAKQLKQKAAKGLLVAPSLLRKANRNPISQEQFTCFLLPPVIYTNDSCES
jgi:hypothetical protein